MYKVGDKFASSQRNGFFTIVAVCEDNTVRVQWESDDRPYVHTVVGIDIALERKLIFRLSKLEEALFNLKVDPSS